MSENAIQIRGLKKTFSKFILGPIDITVPKGAIYGFIGPNAAGKTTTMDLIMGMGQEDEGTIEVLGLDHLKEEVAFKRQVGYVSQDIQFTAWKTILNLVRFIRSFYPDWDDAYCQELMNRLKLDWSDKIATLSFGQRTKLSLLLALSHRPAVLLLDEPMAGLDAVSRHEVYTELLEAVQDENRTVLISSHDLHDIERFTDHIGIINNGQMLLEGNTAELVERFQMLDGVWNGSRIHDPNVPGGTVVKSDDGHLRALIDTQTDAVELYKEAGLTEIVLTPVTLEEMFVSLVKD